MAAAAAAEAVAELDGGRGSPSSWLSSLLPAAQVASPRSFVSLPDPDGSRASCRSLRDESLASCPGSNAEVLSFRLPKGVDEVGSFDLDLSRRPRPDPPMRSTATADEESRAVSTPSLELLHKGIQDPPPGSCFSLGPCACFRHEVRWAFRESETFMLHVVAKVGPILLPCMPRLRDVTEHGARSEKCLIWYNPCWWLTVLACMVMMVAGRFWHSLFCQGRAIRPDEAEVEKMVRVWWVYTYSGGFVLTTLMDTFALCLELFDSPPDVDRVLGYALAMVLSLSYLLMNVNLVYQMACQETMLMHLSAIGKMTYGLAFVVVFAVGEVRGARSAGSGVSAIASLARLVFSVFMLLSLCGYWRILKHRYPDATRREGSNWLRALFIVLFAIYPFVLVLVVFFLGGDKVWEGLAGF